jgi:hypothetical protein
MGGFDTPAPAMKKKRRGQVSFAPLIDDLIDSCDGGLEVDVGHL